MVDTALASTAVHILMQAHINRCTHSQKVHVETEGTDLAQQITLQAIHIRCSILEICIKKEVWNSLIEHMGGGIIIFKDMKRNKQERERALEGGVGQGRKLTLPES